MKKLASLIAKREGKKTEVAIGNIREILKVLQDVEAEARVNEILDANGFLGKHPQDVVNRFSDGFTYTAYTSSVMFDSQFLNAITTKTEKLLSKRLNQILRNAKAELRKQK